MSADFGYRLAVNVDIHQKRISGLFHPNAVVVRPQSEGLEGFEVGCRVTEFCGTGREASRTSA